MNETQVRAAFGDNAQVYYYNGVVSNKFNFQKHYYHVIQAGVPCLLKPSTVSSTYTITGVTINSDAPTSVQEDGYTFTGTYASTNMEAGSYFIGYEKNSNSSTEAQLYITNNGKQISGLRAYLKPGVGAAKITDMSFDEDNSTVTAIEDVTTDETVNNGNIYNLSGQLVKTGATNLDGLDKGIYILNGKKYVVK